MLVFLGPIAHCVTNSSTDRLGRWYRSTINLKQDKTLTLYSIYNVVDTELSKSGPNTIFHQQWRLLRLAGILHPNPRIQMVQDLDRDIKSLNHKESDFLCIMGDFNERLGFQPDLMSSICIKHKLYDVLLH